MAITITDHFRQRFAERVNGQTDRIDKFVNRAYHYGKSFDELENGRQKAYLRRKTKRSDTEVKIYHGYAYCFRDHTAITVLSLPSRVRTGYVVWQPYYSGVDL